MKIMGIGGGVGSDNRRVQRPPFLTKFVAEVGPKKRFPEDPSQLSFKLFQIHNAEAMHIARNASDH